MKRLIPFLTIGIALAAFATPRPAAAQALGTCWICLYIPMWDIGDCIESPVGKRDCDDNQSGTWCDDSPYGPCDVTWRDVPQGDGSILLASGETEARESARGFRQIVSRCSGVVVGRHYSADVSGRLRRQSSRLIL